MKSVYGTPRKCCPVCGGTIVVSDLYQYSIDREIGKRGKLKKRYRKIDCGSMEVSIACCKDCGEYWDADAFYIEDETFFDLKNRKGGENDG